jgi:type IV secretory pathway VirB10-like protein
MSQHDQSEFSEKRTFMGRFGFAIGGLVLVGIIVAVFSQLLNGPKGPPPRKQQEMVMIKPPPPPPPTPPPPPPPPQQMQKQEMMEQQPVDADEAKPEAPEAPSAAIGTNIVGNGPADGFGLGRNTGGFMGGNNSARANRSQFGWYANQVIKSFSEALSKNPRTQNASFSIEAKIWSDAGGRVTRAKLVASTGDSSLDAAIKNEVLTGFQLKEPPPNGMPMPIVMRLSARRPN